MEIEVQELDQDHLGMLHRGPLECICKFILLPSCFWYNQPSNHYKKKITTQKLTCKDFGFTVAGGPPEGGGGKGTLCHGAPPEGAGAPEALLIAGAKGCCCCG